MPTRIEEYKRPRKYNPTPLFSIPIEDPNIFGQAKGKLFDVEVTVMHSLKGVEVSAFQSGTGRSGIIEAKDNESIVFKNRHTVVYVKRT